MTIPEQAELTLVQRLRAISTAYEITHNKGAQEYSACSEAADEIERLRSLVGVERAALPPLRARDEGRWFKISSASEDFIIDNVKHGEVCRGIEGKWAAVFHSRRYGLFDTPGEARAAVTAQLYPLRAREEIARITERIESWRNDERTLYSDCEVLEFCDLVECILSRTAGQEWRDISGDAPPVAELIVAEKREKIMKDIFVIITCVLVWIHTLLSMYQLPCPEGSIAIHTADKNWCVLGTPWRETPYGREVMK